MAETWPSAPFPQRLFLGFQFTPKGVGYRTEMDEGEAKLRAGGNASVWTLDGSIRILDSQFSTWEFFFITTLGLGVEPFTWVHPITHAAMDFRFRSPMEKPPALVGRHYNASILSLALDSLPA